MWANIRDISLIVVSVNRYFLTFIVVTVWEHSLKPFCSLLDSPIINRFHLIILLDFAITVFLHIWWTSFNIRSSCRCHCVCCGRIRNGGALLRRKNFSAISKFVLVQKTEVCFGCRQVSTWLSGAHAFTQRDVQHSSQSGYVVSLDFFIYLFIYNQYTRLEGGKKAFR